MPDDRAAPGITGGAARFASERRTSENFRELGLENGGLYERCLGFFAVKYLIALVRGDWTRAVLEDEVE